MRNQATSGFGALSDEEVIALTDEQIERFVDYECAIRGVPLLPVQEPVAPVKVQPVKDVEVFKVGEFSFTTNEDAISVARYIGQFVRLKIEYANDYRNRIVRPDNTAEIVIQTERHFSPEEWERQRLAVTAEQAAEHRYETERREYDDIAKKRRDATRSILDRIEDVRDRSRERMRMQHEFDRYLELAGGDRSVAARFLAAAKPSARDLLPELYLEGPQDVEPEEGPGDPVVMAATVAAETDSELFF